MCTLDGAGQKGILQWCCNNCEMASVFFVAHTSGITRKLNTCRDMSYKGMRSELVSVASRSCLGTSLSASVQGSCFCMHLFFLVMALALRRAVQECRCMKQAWVLDMITTIVMPFLCKALGRLLNALMDVITKITDSLTSPLGGQAGDVSNACCTRPPCAQWLHLQQCNFPVQAGWYVAKHADSCVRSCSKSSTNDLFCMTSCHAAGHCNWVDVCSAAAGVMVAAMANVYHSTSRNKLSCDCVCWMCTAVSHPATG